jgi:hypothetical protein
MSACGYCGVDIPHRPYSGKRDLPSVSAISECYDDGKSRAMAWAASLIATTMAVHEPEKWEGLSREGCEHNKERLCPACRFMRSEFDRQWDLTKHKGTHVHHLVQSWIHGEDVEVDAECEPQMDAAEAFFTDCEPRWIETERTVLYDSPKSSGYRGTFDWIAEINCPVCKPGTRCKWLGDWKGGKYYPTSQTLQLSAYRSAQHLTRWEDKKEIIEGPVPAVAHAGVVLLGGDGRYTLQELPANNDTFAVFLRLRDAWRWHKDMRRWEREHPLPGAEGIKTDDTDTGEEAA